MKIASAFILGIVAGVALGLALHASFDIPQTESIPIEVVGENERGPSSQVLLQRIAELESQVDALETERQGDGASIAAPVGAQAQTGNAVSGSGLSHFQREVRRLMDEGFTRERAEWIQRRSNELEAAVSSSPESLERDPMYQLRMEVGDSEFERYLIGTGRDPVIYISPWRFAETQAALYGFQLNDRITAYDGQRVFDRREILLMEAEGSVGTPVLVEFIRDGQPMQLFVPRGSFDAGLAGGFLPLTER